MAYGRFVEVITKVVLPLFSGLAEEEGMVIIYLTPTVDLVIQEENLAKNEFSLPWLRNKPLCLDIFDQSLISLQSSWFSILKAIYIYFRLILVTSLRAQITYCYVFVRWLLSLPSLIQVNKPGVSALTQAIGQVLKESPHLGSLLARNGKIVAAGYVVTGLEGEVCHHRTVQKNEGKVHIECVYDDSAPIWDPPQGDDYYKLSSHVGGGWIV
ncbi:hypothetical protein C5167_011494, partial [Papaver somniferum]